MALMKIGEFAKELGVSVQQLRDMDKNGILKPAAVSPKGTRYYSEEQLYRYTPSPTERSSAIVGSARMDRRTTWKPRSRM